MGIISVVRDHLRSNWWIICSPGVICGPVQIPHPASQLALKTIFWKWSNQRFYNYMQSSLSPFNAFAEFDKSFRHVTTKSMCNWFQIKNLDSKWSRSIFSLCLSFLRFTEAAVETNETRLYKDLFKNYNKYTHPVIDESRPVTIVFDYQLIRIIDVVSHIAWKFSALSYPCALLNDLAVLTKSLLEIFLSNTWKLFGIWGTNFFNNNSNNDNGDDNDNNNNNNKSINIKVFNHCFKIKRDSVFFTLDGRLFKSLSFEKITSFLCSFSRNLWHNDWWWDHYAQLNNCSKFVHTYCTH